MNSQSAPSPTASPIASGRKPEAIGAPSDVWVRSLPLWHLWNVGTIVAATAVALLSWRMTPEATLAALALAATLVALYGAMFLRHPRRWGWWFRWAVPYAAAVTICFGLIVQLNPYFGYAEFSLYPQLFFLLYARRRAVLVGALGMAVAMTLGELRLYGPGTEGAGTHILADLVQVLFAFAISAWIGGMAKQSVERRQLIEELEETRRELAVAEREAGVLEERGRLAREIHDTLAQGFASVVAHLEAAQGSMGHDPERVERHLAAAEDVARHSLADARSLAWALRPEALSSGGLPAAIERAVSSTFRGASVATNMTVTGTVRSLHPSVEVTLLRAAQEALANARRHASAHEVTVTLSYFENEVTLDIADDGVGFDPDETAPGPAGGLGLLGLRERVDGLGGSVAIESARGRGTTIGINVPVAREGGAQAVEPGKAVEPAEAVEVAR